MTNTNKIAVYRHIRNGKNGTVVNNGGITLYFEVEGTHFKASAAICGDNENFNANIGRKIAYGRFKSGRILVHGQYDANISLTDNVIRRLAIIKSQFEWKQDAIDWLATEQGTALVKLARYTKALPREPFTGEPLKGRGNFQNPTVNFSDINQWVVSNGGGIGINGSGNVVNFADQGLL